MAWIHANLVPIRQLVQEISCTQESKKLMGYLPKTICPTSLCGRDIIRCSVCTAQLVLIQIWILHGLVVAPNLFFYHGILS